MGGGQIIRLQGGKDSTGFWLKLVQPKHRQKKENQDVYLQNHFLAKTLAMKGKITFKKMK